MGAFLFVPAANNQSYVYFLFASFVIACGLTILETAANPYASALGDPASSTQRLNLAQSFNGLAAFLAPLIGAKVIFTKGNSADTLNAMSASVRQAALASEANTVKTPYTLLAFVLLIIAFLFYLVKLPDIRSKNTASNKATVLGTFNHRHLRWAVITQFFYVGAQVCVLSLFILFATESAGINQFEAAKFLSFGTLAFLIGRFTGTFFMNYITPNKLLTAYGFIAASLCFVAMITHGMVTIYALICICFFMSIMFPTIFSLGIKQLGTDTEMGSSLIIMAIAGGAVLPRIFGIISDATGNIQMGYIVPLIAFLVVTYYGWKGSIVKEIS